MKFKVGDKVKIHCHPERTNVQVAIYDGQIGEILNIWDEEQNPWGHINVILPNFCQNGFRENELEVIEEEQSMTDKEFLTWIYERMQYVHHENPDVDYMRKFKAIIDSLQEERKED